MRGDIFLKYRNISIISALIHTIPPVYRTCGPRYKPLLRTAHDCETGLITCDIGVPFQTTSEQHQQLRNRAQVHEWISRAHLAWIGYECELTHCDIFSMANLFSRLKISRFDSPRRFSFVAAQFWLVPKISFCWQLPINSFEYNI